MPIQRELSAAHPLFRKSWMKYPLLVGSFAFAYHCAVMLPVKLFNKFSKSYKGIDHENTVLLNKIMHIMKRKNKSVSEARSFLNSKMLKQQLAIA